MFQKFRFMEVNFRQNVRVGPELVSALWSDRFTEVSALERLRYKSFLKNWSGTNDTVRLREVSSLGRFHCLESRSCKKAV